MNKGNDTANRLIKGTTVTWIRLIVTMFAQIVTTPVYLHYWSAEIYGTWLIIMAAVGMLQIPGISFQNYVGYELMREAARDKAKFSTLLQSATRLGALYGLFELTIAFLLSQTVIPFTIGADAVASLRRDASYAFFFSALGSGLVWNWGGMWVRGANAVGGYARASWWGVVDGIIKVLAPLVVLPLGFGITGAAAVMAGSLVLLHQFTILDLRKLVRKEMDLDAKHDWKLAWHTLWQSNMLSLKAGLEMLRQQGVRLILGPLLGVVDLAAFATMRTGANAALQGLSSITNPLMPELMRFLSKRDQARSEAAMATVWLVVILFMAPGVVFLQVIAPELFTWWTRGKIPFHPLLFATISAGVLVYAAAQPATAVVRGNNLVKVQFMNSLLAAAVLLGSMFTLVPFLGLPGVGLALLLSEIFSTTGYRIAARRWLFENDLLWPAKASNAVTMSILQSTLTMAAIALLPSYKWAVITGYLPLVLLNIIFYWRHMPQIAISRAQQLLAKIGLHKIVLKEIV